MENVILTQLSVPEIRQILRQELETFFVSKQEAASKKEDTDQLLTIQQAGGLLSLSVPTLYGYVQRNEIPFCKRGKRLYFSKQDLTNWVKESRRKTLSETAEEAQQFTKSKTRK